MAQKGDLLEWAKVTLAARVHSEASVSSAIIRFYPPGTVLQVVRRENGGLERLDPATQERGWVFEKYLSSIDGPSDSSCNRLVDRGSARGGRTGQTSFARLEKSQPCC